MPPEAPLPFQQAPISHDHKLQKFLILGSLMILLIGVGFVGLKFIHNQVITPLFDGGTKALTNDNAVQQYFWAPPVEAAEPAKPGAPQLFAKSAMVFNLDSDKVYYVKNPNMRLPMASITKAMTALLAMERHKSTDVFTVSESAASVGENSLGITAGEKYTLDELLWGLFLKSGNDASEAIAENVAGSKQKFVDLMNKRAIELGMKDTHYTNPYGLEGDGNMYTTVKDLAIITKYVATNFPETFNYTKTIEHQIPQTATHKALYLTSEIDLIRTYPGAIGYKTGFTDEAGRCIITVAHNHGTTMVAIVLGSKDRRVDAVKLLDYAYAQEGYTIKHEPYW